MSYAVEETFYTLQGEGRRAGRAAVFCRFGRSILQPVDGPDGAANTAAAVRDGLTDPCWRPGQQTHKILGIA